jgi:RES domain
MTDINRYPSPREDFNQRSLPILEIDAGSYFYRLNSRLNNQGKPYHSSMFFDRTGCGRWDGANQGYGVLYVGADSYAAYVECYGRKPEQRSFLGDGLLITETELNRRFLARFSSKKQLRFVKVYGSGLQKLGVDSQITSCSPEEYEFPREWGRAFHQHPDKVDGICYLSRHDNTKLCYGIFDRVASQISEEQLCDGQFQPLRLETSSEDSCRNLVKLINRQHPEVNLDSVLQHYGHQITTDSPVTGIDIDDVVN